MTFWIMISVPTPGQTRECQLFAGLGRFVSCNNMRMAINALISETQHTHWLNTSTANIGHHCVVS